MSDIVIYGAKVSNYVRAVRIACIEKGISYRVEEKGHNHPGILKRPKHLALHPFGKIPALGHGDHVVFETPAILRYIDEAFEGPALQPKDAYDRACMTAWISAAVDYFYNSFMRGIVIPYAFANGEPDRARIEEGAKLAAEHAKILNDALEGKDWLAGDNISLAEIIILPMLIAGYNFPEGKAVLENCHNIGKLYMATQERASFQETSIQPPAEAAE